MDQSALEDQRPLTRIARAARHGIYRLGRQRTSGCRKALDRKRCSLC